MKKNNFCICSVIILLTLFFACKNKDKVIVNPETISYTIDSTILYPGSMHILTADKFVSVDSANISIQGKYIKLIKVDSFHYVFYTPIVSTGSYSLNLTPVNSFQSLLITIVQHNSITNSDESIQQSINFYISSLNDIVSNDTGHNISQNDIAFFHQLISQLSSLLSSCTQDEKMAIAYQFEDLKQLINNSKQSYSTDNITKNNSHHTSLTSSYKIKIELDKASSSLGNINFTTTSDDNNDESADLSEELIEKIILAKYINSAAVITAKAVKFSLLALIIIPNTAMAVSTLLITASSQLLKLKAKILNAEIANYAAVATNIETDGKGLESSPEVFKNNESFIQKLKSKFQTLFKSYRSSSSQDVNNFIATDEIYAETELESKSLFEQIKEKINRFFTLVTATYNAYTSQIPSQPKDIIDDIPDDMVTVSQISNSDISIKAEQTDDGLQFTVSNPNNNIKDSTPFTYQLNYTQPLLGNTVTIKQYAIFAPSKDPIIGTWRTLKYDYGRGEIDTTQKDNYFKFNSDGTFQGIFEDNNGAGKWSIQGDELVLTNINNEDFDISETGLYIYSITSDSLVLYSPKYHGSDYTFYAYYIRE